MPLISLYCTCRIKHSHYSAKVHKITRLTKETVGLFSEIPEKIPFIPTASKIPLEIPFVFAVIILLLK